MNVNNPEKDYPFGGAGTGINSLSSYIQLPKMDLETLLNHPTPEVRCEAFWAIIHRKDLQPLPYLIQHLDDTLTLEVQWGCLFSNGISVTNEFIGMLGLSSEGSYQPKNFGVKELAVLDSILIMKPNDLREKKQALKRHQPQPHFYKRIKGITVEEQNEHALVALAKYQKEEDLHLFQKKPYNYLAISNFPHPKLWETLGNELENNPPKEIYKAIAAYQNEKSLTIINKRVQELDTTFFEYHYKNEKKFDDIFKAISEHKCVLYDSLLWYFWESQIVTDNSTFHYLSGKDPQRAMRIVNKELKNTAYNIYSKGTCRGLDYLENLIRFSESYNHSSTVDFLVQNLKANKSPSQERLLEITEDIKDDRILEILLDLFSKDGNAQIACVIISYNDPIALKRFKKMRSKDEYCKKGSLYGDEIDACLKELSK